MSRGSSVILERRFVPKDTLIMRQGEEGNSAYLIQSGSVEVYTEHEGKKIVLATLGLGEIFGEMALIFDESRTASVVTLEDCNLIVITRQSFQQKLKKTDPTIKAIVQMLTQRIISANNTVVNRKDQSEDLYQTVQLVYQNVLAGLPQDKKHAFQDSVVPKLDDFLDALRAFEESAD